MFSSIVPLLPDSLNLEIQNQQLQIMVPTMVHTSFCTVDNQIARQTKTRINRVEGGKLAFNYEVVTWLPKVDEAKNKTHTFTMQLKCPIPG